MKNRLASGLVDMLQSVQGSVISTIELLVYVHVAEIVHRSTRESSSSLILTAPGLLSYVTDPAKDIATEFIYFYN